MLLTNINVEGAGESADAINEELGAGAAFSRRDDATKESDWKDRSLPPEEHSADWPCLEGRCLAPFEIGYSALRAQRIGQFVAILSIPLLSKRRFDSLIDERDEATVLGRLMYQIPPGRLGEAEDVAEAIIFLASDEAAW